MAIFCYKTKDGEIEERSYSIGKAPRFVMVGSKPARRCLAAEIGSIAMPSLKGWPFTCCASGVHASQAPDLRKHLTDAGIPTEVTDDGDPVYRSAAHRRQALRARGIHDKASFC